jgi:RimJ/RimL family protein N-acetyltransferase
MYYEMSLRNQAHLARFESGNPIHGVHTLQDAEKLMQEFRVAWQARTSFFFGAFEKRNGDFAAQIYMGVVSWDLPEFELGYVVDHAHEGQGFVSEAARGAIPWIFDTFKAHRISLLTDDTNLRSIRVAERCGFVREGHLRENKLRPGGEITGTVCFGLLKTDLH